MAINRKIVLDVALFALSQVALYYGVKWVLNSMDPHKKKRDEAKLKSSKIFSRLGIKDLELGEHEEIIATEVIHPDDIGVGFKDIGGLDGIVDSLKETVIYPLCYPQLFNSSSGLLGAPKGVLLYGPPGCGKTMLAKALAKESGATFINLHMSTLTEKWFGESQKLVKAVFSLAQKLNPPSSSLMKSIHFFANAEFMSLWDGLATGESRVLVLGATNRPNDIDKAILRRMPQRIPIKIPGEGQRYKVLKLLLKNVALDKNFDFEKLVIRTDGLSGSDLKELCRNAAMIPVREAIRRSSGKDIGDVDPASLG
ncbi:ATPase [Chytridium lagenaria]|nr:ATPase [Chytridium lagenaria]